MLILNEVPSTVARALASGQSEEAILDLRISVLAIVSTLQSWENLDRDGVLVVESPNLIRNEGDGVLVTGLIAARDIAYVKERPEVSQLTTCGDLSSSLEESLSPAWYSS